MLFAWAVEAAFGWPEWLYKRIRHPVVWIGALISACDSVLNRPLCPHRLIYVSGAVTSLLVIIIAMGIAVFISARLPVNWWGVILEALIASSLIASRSLYTHVAAVAGPLGRGDVDIARKAVSMIVGRDPNQLDEAGIARASLESLAENASDGVAAPLFWGAIFGLPGLAAYKAINTLDSMIGHKNNQYAAFGGFAARLDDVANIIPARLTGLLISVASLSRASFKIMLRDARHHRSPNAGWPEAAMAGALNVRLSGPRTYGNSVTEQPWLNHAAPDPRVKDMRRGLTLYIRAMFLGASILAFIAWGTAG
ncbi:MAG: adenosylcobinamide-phosphate synthase CbiB [Pseudomonadota bacterium]